MPYFTCIWSIYIETHTFYGAWEKGDEPDIKGKPTYSWRPMLGMSSNEFDFMNFLYACLKGCLDMLYYDLSGVEYTFSNR